MKGRDKLGRFKKGYSSEFYGRKYKTGREHPLFKEKVSYRYVYVYSPNHPFKHYDNKIPEHRLVMESYRYTK